MKGKYVTKKIALVTGSAKRIGRSLSLYLAQNGYDIAIHYNHSEADALSLKNEIEALGKDAKLFQCDLTDENKVNKLIPSIVSEMGNLRVLVNSASIFKPSSLEGSEPQINKDNIKHNNSMDCFDEHFKINLKAPLLLSRSFGTHIDTGLIVNITDAKVSNYQTEFFDYLLSKKALQEATKMAAVEFAPRIRVNGIAPGWIQSPEYLKEDETALLNKIPLNQQGSDKNILEALRYILQNEYVTGDIMYVDGGLSVV